jgi:urea transport system ATP-binding protein
MSALLQLVAVEADIAGSRILRGVNLEVNAGEVVALMGRNGVGKTTTLRCITGLLPVRNGTVTFDGQKIAALAPDVRARAGIAYVPQGRDIFPHLTVLENLQISSLSRGGGADGSMDRVLELFPVLKEMLSRKGGVLSGGQQQQLAIARALLMNPDILLLDEPTEGIQPNVIDLIGETLLKIKNEGKISILLVEQYLDFCLGLGDRFSIMDRGSIVAEGPISGLNDATVRQHLTV